MCGIAGIFNRDDTIPTELIRAMTGRIRHRGPDDAGLLLVNTRDLPNSVLPLSRESAGTDYHSQTNGLINLALGHRRLAIIDVSSGGHQPMCVGKHLAIVFNGEIYNYIELRRELRSHAYEFATESDTEVILAAYDCWGTECVKRFNGDWAFCILDMRSRQLFLSRDRYGIKPLFFFHDGGKFAFASEIKALLALPFVPCAVNLPRAIDFWAEHLADHTDETLFDNIKQVLPGENMSLDLGTGALVRERYYSLGYCTEIGEYNERIASQYIADIRDLLFDSVRIRLRADVAVGTCLSGGLDSSTIAAIAAKLLGKDAAGQFNSFTSSFPGLSIDETAYAVRVAEAIGVKNHLVYPTERDFWAELGKIQAAQDEPVTGASLYAQWAVMREASKHVKVLLDGQGGDEVFVGYRNYRVSYLAGLIRSVACGSAIREGIMTAWHAGGVLNAILELRALPLYLLSPRSKRLMSEFVHSGDRHFAGSVLSLAEPPRFQWTERLYRSDFPAFLADAMTISLVPLLRYEDRNSMAYSIESRAPFTDYRVVDYVFKIPAVYKIRNGWTKWLLRNAVSGLLPHEIVWRKTKLGFPAPEYATPKQYYDMWVQHLSTLSCAPPGEHGLDWSRLPLGLAPSNVVEETS